MRDVKNISPSGSAGDTEKRRANYVIQWKTHDEQQEAGQRTVQKAVQRDAHRSSRAYRDPTADAAIGNIMREERMKKRQKDRNCQNTNYQKERNRRRAEAWRAAKAREAKAQQSEVSAATHGGNNHVEK